MLLLSSVPTRFSHKGKRTKKTEQDFPLTKITFREHHQDRTIIQKFTENDKKPELMGKVVIINPISLRRKKRPPISYFTNIYKLIITKT